MTYFLGGYYLIKLRPVAFGSLESKCLLTCSSCINDSLLDNWSYSWTTDNDKNLNDLTESYKIDKNVISELRAWVDIKLEEKKIGWIDLFRNLETAKAYRRNFFADVQDVKIIAIYFNEQEASDLVDKFEPEKEIQESIGLYQNIKNRTPEITDGNEIFRGFDIIGIELDGSFHTFHCHDLANELAEKFNIHINQFGLYDNIPNFQEVSEYMNDENNGFEPVPWFVVKTVEIVD